MKILRYIIVLLIVIGVLVVASGIIYGWLLGQTIYQSMYESKAGVNFWNTWTLEWNIFTASALLAILSWISLPQRSTFLTFISALSGTGPTLKRLTVSQSIIWKALELGGFFVFYISTGGYSITGQNVAFLLMLMGHESISITSEQMSTLFSLPFSPGTSAATIESLIPAMEAYQLYLGLVGTLIFATGVRIGLTLVTDFLSEKKDIYIIAAKSLSLGAIASILEILSVPMWTVNAGTWMTYLTLIIVLFSCIIGAIGFSMLRLRTGDARSRLRSKIQSLEDDLIRLQGELASLRQEYESGAMDADEYRTRVSFLMEDRSHISNELRRLKLERMLPAFGSSRSFGVLAVILIVLCISLPIIQGFYYGVQMEGDKYVDWKFGYETEKEIAITSWASGVSDIESLTLDDLTSNATPEGEVEFLNTVRQWDNTASYLRMRNQIGTNWMQLADSDIVYLRNHEYWIAPLTFDRIATSTNFISQHLIYTHTEGLVVLDAFSGDVIEHENLVALLNRSQGIQTYYGEGSSFYDAAFVNVPGFQEVGNHSFQGEPDYRLQGFESLFYFFGLGPDAWSFLGRDMDILLERDVISRVRSIMLQGITVDSDPYIVVDASGDLHYAVSVYTDYRLSTGYAKENYMRFLGVILVGIESGELSFYKSPTIVESFFIEQTYMNYYDWQEAPLWLQRQMKWPEDLYERQLDVAYFTHVKDGLVWQSGRDFHESPSNSDTRYIIMRIGGVERFVAMHNTEFLASPGQNLAGIYVMGCGDKNFGKLQFYSAGSEGYSTYLGPNAAVQAFETADQVRTQLQLWGAHRYGNRLLYHLGGDLFFVIPVFLEVETSTDIVIEKLGGVGLVDVETGKRVELGSNVIEAYYQMFGFLNETTVDAGEVGFESAHFNPVTINSGDFSQLVTLIRNNDDISHNITLEISVFAGNFSIDWHGLEVVPYIYPTNKTFTMNIGTVGPGDLYGTSPKVTAFLETGLVYAQYLVIVTLRTEDGVMDQVSLFMTIT